MIKNYADKYAQYGDHVICSNCGEEMIVNVGEDTCPKCKTEGVLAWADKNNPEVKIEY